MALRVGGSSDLDILVIFYLETFFLFFTSNFNSPKMSLPSKLVAMLATRVLRVPFVLSGLRPMKVLGNECLRERPPTLC